ncbi:hypothetical protein H4C81_20175 [Pseudomonas monteilii]|uniref:hypothetical protein n=1 Tax=Pseudomonas monteilii TaxID=76759 RepID=UPI0015FB4AF9|nr:hypothetical protein [Pseudomonas monteilii]MBA6091184.1 hypothetical protein [Pseudomonas monteilii]
MSNYELLDVEIFFDPRRGENRARPLPGQKYPPSLVVECSKKFRQSNPVGSKFRLFVKEKEKKSDDCRVHLYSYYRWEVQALD